MSMSDPIADLLTRIRNAQMVGKASLDIPSSKLKQAICQVMADEGYIQGYEVVKQGAKAFLKVDLKYFNGRPVIENIERVSKPSRRIYKAKDELPKVQGGLGIAIISTSQGVMTDKQARQKGCGGEVLCTIS